MIKPSLSIIMPVYNGAEFIVISLESILSQITVNVDVIVVDDGSTDNTVELINKHFKSYINRKQLVIYSETNQGVSAARNVGIAHAQGQYIGFLDADDVLLPNYIQTITNAIDKGNDIVEFGFKRFVDFTSQGEVSKAEYTNSQFGTHLVKSVVDKVYSGAKWYPWTRIFKAELFEGVRFPNGVKFCEDLMTIPKLYEKAETIEVLKDAVYGYRTNLNSATFTVAPSYIDNLVVFYNTIPSSNLTRICYLKMSVAYSIISCQTKLSGNWELPRSIQEDMVKLRCIWPIYYNVKLRRVAILCYPKLFHLFRKLK